MNIHDMLYMMDCDGHHWKVLSESESEISEDPMEAPVNASITIA